ncbi:hypothetical protein Tco_0892902 [Tanacetum coccineum]|uniref:Uncharacterized protein n=1 Tax=Tanacetum coccineum TaxID=301880 RepID=A0ABQ5C796_9ASTR
MISLPHGIRHKIDACTEIGQGIACVNARKFTWDKESAGVSKFSRQLVKDDRRANFIEKKNFSICSLAFSRRFSSFLLDGNGIDALGIGVSTGETFGSGFYTRLNLNNRRLDVFGASVISRRHRVLCPHRVFDIGLHVLNTASLAVTYFSKSVLKHRVSEEQVLDSYR